MVKHILAICLLGALTLTAHGSDERDTYYEDANRLFFDKDFKATLIQLKNALQLDPEHVPSLLLAGKTYQALGQPAAAEDSLFMARVLGADKSVVNLALAKIYLQQAKYQSIINQLSADDLPAQDKVELLGYIARAWIGLDNLPEAAASIGEADAIRRDALRPNLARVLLLLSTEQFDQALETSQKLTQNYPEISEAWNSLASVFHAMGNIEAALNYYRKAIELEDSDVNARLAVIGIYASLGEFNKTLAHLEYLANHYPYEPRAAYFRALSWSKLASADNDFGDKYPVEMRKCVEIIAQLPPETVTRDQQVAMIATLAHYSLGEFEASKYFLGHFLKKFPYDPRANRLMGDILLRLNDPIGAIRVLRPTAQSYPNDPQLTTLLASAYVQAGQHDKATRLLEELESSGNGSQDSRQLLGINLLQSGYTDAGINTLLSTFEQDSTQSETGFTLAVAQLTDGRDSEAIATAQKLVSEDKNPSNLNLLGIAYRSSGQLKKALEIFNSIVEQHPELVPAIINLAKTEEALGQIESSYQRLDQLKTLHPENTSVLLALAQLESRRGKLTEAISLAEKAMQLHNKRMDIRVLLVDLYLDAGNFNAAENIAASTLLLDENGFISSKLMAKVYLTSGRTRQAISLYKRMSKEAGFNTEKLYKISQLQQQAGALEAARHTLYKALEGSPNHAPSKISYIQLQLRLEEFNDALKHAMELLEIYPKDSFAHLLVAESYRALGQISEAEGYYANGLKLRPHPLLLSGLYGSLMAQGKVNQAGELIQKHWESQGQPLAGDLLSQHLMREDKWSQAKEVLFEILASEPDNAGILNNLAYTLYRLGDPHALHYAEKAYHLDPDNPIVNDTVGWILTENDKADEGLKYLRQAIARASADSEIRYHLAVALHRLNRQDESWAELKKALESGQRFQGIDHARHLLKTMTQ